MKTSLSVQEKLDKLYEMRDKLHPLAVVLIVGFVETQHRVMKPHDEAFVNDIWDIEFPDKEEDLRLN